MNKKGWVEIIEAFIAILLIVGVLLIVISRNSSSSNQDISTRVYNSEITIIRAIELNDSLRDKVVKSPVPVEWDNESFPADVKSKITALTPSYLTCVAKICSTSDSCFLSSYSQQNVYSQSSLISGTQLTFTPRKLNLFCWAK